ncbi:Gx transporter family protein [Thermosipho atlanticus]|uniref:Heptaprenyl diphosphate synthase n=1 Tax=Thermosipho atlanticus DSM 15807 TaxID=1123380 RepID=A0A1M5RX62_9BACT|nr:Gx transporter family protein [Thermosipho atlanticus]SHH30780.1 heptaprenyl diphosphate synthase [Thermosipho atlanticus DSM 15807]
MYSLLVSLASAMFIIERFIPYPVPGGKWGFSNFIVLFAAVNLGIGPAIIIGSLKSIIGSIFTGLIFTPTFFMGFLGVIAAAIVEGLFSKTKFLGYTGLSFLGMISNNIVQLYVGALLIKSTAIFSFLPIMLSLGAISAFANAYLAKKMEEVLNENNFSFKFTKKN